MSKGGLLGRVWQMVRRIREMDIPVHAANAGYFIVLSVFPALVLLLSALRYTTLDIRDLMAMLEGLIPGALLPAAEKLIVSTYAHASSAMVSVSALSALWSASRGMYGIMQGLNGIYRAQEDRGYVHTRLISLLYTFLLLVVLVLTLVLNVFRDGLLEMLSMAPSLRFLTEVVDLRNLLLLCLQTGVFAAMFMVLPNRKNRFSESLPGALLASVGWLIFTKLFSLYVTCFRRDSGIYGSVYTLALSMLWLYCCLSILFAGGGLNQLMAEKKK